METSAPKRRRTSPHTSVPGYQESGATSTAPPDEPPQPNAAAKRPSFASPTKASLERHNPDILQRRSSPPKRSRREDSAALPASHSNSRGSIGASHAQTTQVERQSEPTGKESVSQKDGSNVASLGEESVLRSPARRLGVKRSSLNPKPRPLPPPAPEEDEEIFNPFARRGLRRSPPPGVSPEPIEAVIPEPELPPTPEQPDPVVSTPPSGIHNTPSRRPRRNKALAEHIKSSSPLKNPPVTSSPHDHDALPSFRLPSKTSKLSRPVSSQGPTTAEIRGIQPSDPEEEKRKQRDALLAQIAKLEKDLDVALKESERIHNAHLSNTEPSPPPNRQEILDLLRRYTLPESEELESESSSWVNSALDPIAFLPFAQPTSKPPSLFLPDDEKEAQKPPVSQHPLPMSAEEALPYLQVLTTLTFTSHITIIRNPDDPSPTAPLLQKQIINATSTAPRGLFSARIDMTVNTRTLAIMDLAVPRLDPAAVAELTPLIKRIVTKSEPMNSALTNNVNVLTWGMGEWLRLSTQRAKVWCVLERELTGGEEALEEMVERVRQKKKKRKRRKGRDDEEEEAGEMVDNEDGGKFGVEELLPFMGRTSMDFQIPVLTGGDGGDNESMLRVQWRIGFDWIGDGKHEVRVLVGVPGKWHKHDERGRLSGIPQLFHDLMDGGEDPLSAVRTVACLLAGEQRS